MILELLDEAVAAGARRFKACEVLGLSVRSTERWRLQDGGEDGRAGPRTPPTHKLSEEERQAVLDIANSPEFRDKSPRQIVPILADGASTSYALHGAVERWRSESVTLSG